MTKQFKSERAAKMAYTKAEKAWEAARGATARQTHEFNPGGWNEERFAVIRELRAKEVPLFEAMRAIYEQATAQKFYIRTWHFGVNPTRDLVSANMD